MEGGQALTTKYADMIDAERWEWHAGVYAFRRVVLDVSADERTSPCDTEGKWFDPDLVAQAERELRAKRVPRRRANDEEMQREGRAVANQWARQRRFRDFAGYMLAERLDYDEALAVISRSILAGNQMDTDPDDLGERQAEFVTDEGKAAQWADTL
jgi:hypothetical protein